MCFLLLSIIFLSLIPFRCTGRRTSTPRQQVNKLTSYIDGSVVNGETEERNKALREFKDGKMKLGLGDLLPVSLLTNHNEKPKNIGFVLSISNHIFLNRKTQRLYQMTTLLGAMQTVWWLQGTHEPMNSQD